MNSDKPKYKPPQGGTGAIKPRIPVKNPTGNRHPYDFVESMTRIELYRPKGTDGAPELATVVRVWREEQELRSNYDATNEDLRQKAYSLDPFNRDGILKAMCDMPRVTAVEVTDADGCGVVVYTDW